MEKVKQSAAELKIAAKNFERLVQALSLIVVSVYVIKQALTMPHKALFFVLVISGSVVAIEASLLFWKHLTNK